MASVNDEAITLSEVQEEGQPVIRKIFQDFVGSERERRVEEAQQRSGRKLIQILTPSFNILPGEAPERNLIRISS